ncbi:MAG: hypothetical protein ACJ72U_10340 [Nitrososphaeraceae archaeon]
MIQSICNVTLSIILYFVVNREATPTITIVDNRKSSNPYYAKSLHASESSKYSGNPFENGLLLRCHYTVLLEDIQRDKDNSI